MNKGSIFSLIAFVLMFNLFGIGLKKVEAQEIERKLSQIESPLFVSLGSHCEIAAWLRAFQMRQTAFPFDWLLTLDHENFLNILKEDFAHFIDPLYFFLNPACPVYLENAYYEIEFRHDWPEDDPTLTFNEERHLRRLEAMREKYPRRVERFREIRNYGAKVYFFRLAFDFNNDPNVYWGKPEQSKITRDEAIALKEALDNYFPMVNFELVIVNWIDEDVPWISGIEGIREFKLRKTDKASDFKFMFDLLRSLN